MTTTTPVNACNATVYLDNHSGVAKNISGMANNLDFEISNTLGEYRVFDIQWMLRMACVLDGSVELKVVYSKDVDGGHDLLADWIFSYNKEARRLRFFLPTEEIGAELYEGYYFIENYAFTVSAEEAGPIMGTASLKPNGEITRSVAVT